MDVIGQNANFKIPYYWGLLNGLTGHTKANIMRTVIADLDEIGLSVTATTCDGPPSNYKMMGELGVRMHGNTDELLVGGSTAPEVCSFKNPADDGSKYRPRIAAFLDPAHMLKLMRNLIGGYYDSNLNRAYNRKEKRLHPEKFKKEIPEDTFLYWPKKKGYVDWKYVIALHKLQTETSLRSGNRLKPEAVDYHRHKMKVKLAAQTLSRSVADSIDHCRNSLKLPQFYGSEATSTFIRIIDHIFDILNSKQTGYW
jgi:hypothetical protein